MTKPWKAQSSTRLRAESSVPQPLACGINKPSHPMSVEHSKLGQLTDIVVLAGGRALQVVAQIVSLRVATTLLTPANMGSVNQMLSIASLFGTTLVAPVSLYLSRGFLEWVESGQILSYFRQFLYYLAAAAACSLLVVGGLQQEWALVNGIALPWVLVLSALFIVGSSVSQLSISLLNVLGHRRLYVGFTNLSVWVGFGLAVGLFYVMSEPVYWILGQYLGPVVACLSGLFLVSYLRKMAVSKSGTSRTLVFEPAAVFAFSWPQGLTLLLWWVQAQSYRFVLDYRAGLVNVGLFTVGAGLCYSIMAAYTTLFNEFYGPSYLRDLKGQNREGQVLAWNKYASAYVPSTILVGAFLIGGSPFLAKAFLGREFQSVSELLIWPALTETISAIGATLHFLGIAKVDMKMMVLPVAVGAVLAPTGVYFLAPIHPLHGTGGALLLAAVGALLVVILTAHHQLPITWPLRRIGGAVALSLPMVLGLRVASWALPELTVLGSVMSLLLGGGYLLFAQHLMTREWLGAMKPAGQ